MMATQIKRMRAQGPVKSLAAAIGFYAVTFSPNKTALRNATTATMSSVMAARIAACVKSAATAESMKAKRAMTATPSTRTPARGAAGSLVAATVSYETRAKNVTTVMRSTPTHA